MSARPVFGSATPCLRDMAGDVVGTWDDFSDGHWGAIGPHKAPPSSYGGTNALLNRQGNIGPVSASRALTLTSAANGKVWGIFWAWGADGLVYYVQNVTTSTYALRSFNPDPRAVPLAVNTLTGTLTGPVVYEPDWTTIHGSVYMTIWGDATYVVTPATNAFTGLTGTYGAAPAGRCIALYGDRVVIGGVKDSTFGDHPNRIHFSGDDTNNDPTVKTAWEALNFFDVGADGTPITGLYPIRDGLVVVLADQQVWTVTGVPGVNGSLRRAYGFHKGVSAVEAFVSGHGVVDPSQTRVWMFDHTIRAPARFNGGTYTRVPGFGSPHASRTANDLIEGAVTSIGGPDEFVFHGVALPRSAGADVTSESLELVRINNVFNVVQRDVLAGS